MHIGSTEYSELKSKGLPDAIRDSPGQLIDTVGLLAHSQTFKSTCSIGEDW